MREAEEMYTRASTGMEGGSVQTILLVMPHSIGPDGSTSPSLLLRMIVDMARHWFHFGTGEFWNRWEGQVARKGDR